MRFLLKGDVLRSLWYHPLVGYMAAVMAAEFGGWVIRRWGNGRRGNGGILGHYEAEIYVGIGIAAVNWAVKNGALLGWGVELIP